MMPFVIVTSVSGPVKVKREELDRMNAEVNGRTLDGGYCHCGYRRNGEMCRLEDSCEGCGGRVR